MEDNDGEIDGMDDDGDEVMGGAVEVAVGEVLVEGEVEGEEEDARIVSGLEEGVVVGAREGRKEGLLEDWKKLGREVVGADDGDVEGAVVHTALGTAEDPVVTPPEGELEGVEEEGDAAAGCK